MEMEVRWLGWTQGHKGTRAQGCKGRVDKPSIEWREARFQLDFWFYTRRGAS